ncbi:MAG: AAA family ATPase [Myxococcales bacterium]|nr:AAA family ATPase [Myxococcales bacterium]
MCAATKLELSALRRSCRPADVAFKSTDDAQLVEGVVGQDRAVEALRFGIGIKRHGYNLFAIGPPGVGKQTLLRDYLERSAGEREAPADWCYVHNFDEPGKPRLLELPCGRGMALAQDMNRALAQLRVALRAAFESEEYRTRRKQLVSAFAERQKQALDDIEARAVERDVALLHTKSGIGVAPLRDGKVMPPEQFSALEPDVQERIGHTIEEVSEELGQLLRQFNHWGREHHEALRQLDREIATTATHHMLEPLRRDYAELPAVLAHLEALEADVVDSVDDLLQQSSPEDVEAVLKRAFEHAGGSDGPLRRYQVNVLVGDGSGRQAPVVYEDNPTYANLVGRIEHESHFGTTMTHFTLIKPGALHRASGGYLIVDALKLLLQPFAWDALKRALRSGEIRIESVTEAIGLPHAASLDPEPVPLRDTKVILVGERLLYYLLVGADPDFLELFKVLVDFEEQMDRHEASQSLYARLVATLVRKEELLAFDRSAVASVIDYAARRAGDAEKLSVHMRQIVDLLREASYYASEAEHGIVGAADVRVAVEAQLRRASRVQDRLLEAMRRGDILVATDGAQVGQVNGLAVFQLGEQTFGHPTRITARVRLGAGEVVDIEREVKLGGPIHSKGVLILSGFLGSRFVADIPLTLAATLVFEQSYGGVDGDSASMAELCALLSALAEAPIKQSFALTGSVDQRGNVQAIGGVNDKIEGFFDVCADRGLTGEQGVLIPASNVKHLMLRDDVVAAVAEGKFSVHAIEHVDDAIALLTGVPAGVRDAAGNFSSGSINARVEARLRSFAESARRFSRSRGSSSSTGH